MAPKSTEGLSSFPQLVYPSLRDGGIKDAYQWIKGKAMDDGAEGLWRVGDKLYDVSDFIKQHPGGQDWLYMTRGTDITEVFEIHHFSRYPEQLLSKFYIRDAKTPRNSPFTFKEDGFYKTLKNRVREEMKKIPDDQSYKTRNIMDFLVLSVFIFSVLMVNVDWWLLKWTMCTMAGLTMAWTSICAHNFMHKKDNWRMYTFNLGFMACDEWRISHVLSHHVFPNMLQDYEMSGIEPMLQYLPRKDKSLWVRYAPYLYSIVVYFSFCMTQGLKRLVRLTIARNVDPNGPWFNKGMRLEYLVPFTVPLAMSVLSRVSFGEVMWSWMAIVFMNSIIFGFIGLNAAHHHPEIFHDGDAAPRDTDWGIFQLISVMDRRDINSSLFLVMTNFGDHIMHHLFPTLDHTLLPLLYPVAEKTCEEFKQKMLLSTQAQLIVGQFQQLSRNVPLERTEIKRTKK